jgi:hypothetical protein
MKVGVEDRREGRAGAVGQRYDTTLRSRVQAQRRDSIPPDSKKQGLSRSRASSEVLRAPNRRPFVCLCLLFCLSACQQTPKKRMPSQPVCQTDFSIIRSVHLTTAHICTAKAGLGRCCMNCGIDNSRTGWPWMSTSLPELLVGDSCARDPRER